MWFRILGKCFREQILQAQLQECLFLNQNNNKTWHTEDPDLTVCFERTVLVWIPCAFLWIFLILEVIYIKHSMDRNVPWGVLNCSKLVFTGALILLTIVDLCMAISLHNNSYIFLVDYYTPLIKIITFVSREIE